MPLPSNNTQLANTHDHVQSSLLPLEPYVAVDTRDVKKVPFVDLFDTRLQGIVSSGSDIERVYVSYFEVRTLNYNCSTNNNRPCGGLRGHPCNHLRELMHEAVVQFGLSAVIGFLQVSGDPTQINTQYDILSRAGRPQSTYAPDIFSRFLSDLEYLELPSSHVPLSTMSWFYE